MHGVAFIIKLVTMHRYAKYSNEMVLFLDLRAIPRQASFREYSYLVSRRRVFPVKRFRSTKGLSIAPSSDAILRTPKGLKPLNPNACRVVRERSRLDCESDACTITSALTKRSRERLLCLELDRNLNRIPVPLQPLRVQSYKDSQSNRNDSRMILRGGERRKGQPYRARVIVDET